MAELVKTYIMCGGSGTRLWPLSRTDNPKQMLRLLGQQSMLEATVSRAAAMRCGADVSVNIIGSSAHQDALNTLHSVEDVLIEPCGRNTAAAVALAALHAETGDDPHVLILPSDHAIDTVRQFSASMVEGLKASNEGQIVTFGIEPDRPATGYGYIEAASSDVVSKVTRFVEKPDLETAQTYLTTGRHLWNAGIFLARASTFLAELQAHAPAILQTTRTALASAKRDGSAVIFDADLYASIPADSIDYAVMEKSSQVSAVRAAFSWSDIGSFSALKEISVNDTDGNAIHGDIVAVETTSSFLRSEGPLLATFGLDNITAIATPDATFIAPLDRAEEVKQVVSALQKNEHPELNRTPWLAEGGATPGAMVRPFRNWLFETALPFWLDHGLDQDKGGFHEVLDFGGKNAGADKRLRTMARQIYVFAKAKEMGWTGDTVLAVEHGLAFLNYTPTAHYGGWFKTFTASSEPLDRTEDVYDHAFVLLAASQALRAGFDAAQPLARRVLSFLESMETRSPDEAWNGYLEDGSGTLPRRSNPHMHLLEAFLAWHEASGDALALSKASQIVSLLTEHFSQQDDWLHEEFDASLNRADHLSGHMEPGHHFEWSWLLHRHALQSGEAPQTKMRTLIASAKAFGINPVTSLAYDQVEANGRPAHLSSRCWPQTELLKAELALARHGLPHSVFAAERSAERLWTHFIQPAPAGLWNDVCDVSGRPIAQTVPASTFYHLICAIDVYLRFHAER